MSDYWEENGIEKPQQIVVCAACKLSGHLVLGVRHFDKLMVDTISNLPMKLKWQTAEQGFIDQFGDFLTREEAMKIVKENGQPFNVDRNGDQEEELYSEGLY